eukprot:8149310-Pyramimonas_sp.AAC.1
MHGSTPATQSPSTAAATSGRALQPTKRGVPQPRRPPEQRRDPLTKSPSPGSLPGKAERRG